MLASYDPETRQLTIILTAGKFDYGNLAEFRNAWHKHQGSDIDIISVDFREVKHMDSAGLGMLMNMRKAFRDRTRMELVNCTPQIKKILSITRMDKKFRIF
jgi:anti-anti-sigma factor